MSQVSNHNLAPNATITQAIASVVASSIPPPPCTKHHLTLTLAFHHYTEHREGDENDGEEKKVGQNIWNAGAQDPAHPHDRARDGHILEKLKPQQKTIQPL